MRARSARGSPAISSPWPIFRRTVRHGKIAISWNTTPRSRPGPRTSLPSQVMVPSLGLMKPAMALSSVVLPQPLGPTSVTNSPAQIVMSTRPVACTGPSAVSKKCRKPEMTIFSGVGGAIIRPREAGEGNRA